MKLKTACLAASLAAAGLATTGMAQAQSSVTLYGIVDINMEVYNNAPDGSGGAHTVSGMRSGGQSGSRWGLRGSEDLGNGLKAIFQLEAGFNSNTGDGDGRMFQRTSMVGLAANWGELTLGRQYTSSFSLTGNFTPLAWGAYEPIARITPVRVDNAIKYRGKFGGADLSAYYSFSNQRDQIVNDYDVTNGYGLAATYQFGMFRVLGSWDRAVDTRTLGVRNDNQMDNFIVGVRADIDKLKITGIYRYRDQETPVGPDQKSHLYALGLGFQATPAAGIEFGYYHERFKDNTQYAYMSDDKWSQFALRGTYALSKRTNLYAIAAHAIDGPLRLDNNTYGLASGKEKQTGGAIGIRHLF